MTLLWIVFAPSIAALTLAILPRVWLARLTTLIPALTFVFLLTTIAQAETLAVSIPWIPSLGVSLSFFMDGLGLLFALIISGVGALVLFYSGAYFESSSDFTRFTTYTLIFMTAMLGIVLSANLLLMFIFWELTSFMSYLLIGFKHEYVTAQEGARRALLITGGGGLAMMTGFLLIGIIAQTYDIPQLLSTGNILRENALYAPLLILVLIGAFSKSAQWPLHFWLPGAMEAPTPASTYLHSATMVKAGIFLLAHLSPILNNTDLWFYMLTIFGLITFLYAAIIALRQTDMKAILAYSTVSWLGILVALQGSSSEYATIALVTGILAHALYKGALFLMAGNIGHATGTRDITQFGKLARIMPFTFVGTLIAALSMAGIPPLMGFLAKETLKAAALVKSLPLVFQVIFPIAAVIGSALTIVIAFRILWDTFLGNKPAETPHYAHEVDVVMWISPLILGVFAIVMPLAISQTLDPLVGWAVSAIRQETIAVHLHLYEGLTLPLILSLIAIGIGLVIFYFRQTLITWLMAQREFNPIGAYEWLFFVALPKGAKWLTERIQTGRLRYYVRVIMAVFITSSLITILLSHDQVISDSILAGIDWPIAFICLLLMIGAVAGILAPTRLSAIAVLGIEGALLSLVFALFGAPDLALTQLMIEVVTLVLFVLAFHFLPDTFASHSTRRGRITDLCISVGAGFVVTILILVAQSNPVAETISHWHIENAYEVGEGHNVVNVILVDFRGLDTQGEITVLVIAAMGVAALLRLRPLGQPRGKYLAQETPDAESKDIEAAASTAPQGESA